MLAYLWILGLIAGCATLALATLWAIIVLLAFIFRSALLR